MLDKFDQVLKSCYEKSTFLKFSDMANLTKKHVTLSENSLQQHDSCQQQNSSQNHGFSQKHKSSQSQKQSQPNPLLGFNEKLSSIAGSPQKLQPPFSIESFKDLFLSIPQEEQNHASPSVDIFVETRPTNFQ